MLLNTVQKTYISSFLSDSGSILPMIGSNPLGRYELDAFQPDGLDVRDAWREFIEEKTDFGGTPGDNERAFLVSMGATGETLHDLWASFCGGDNDFRDNLRARLSA